MSLNPELSRQDPRAAIIMDSVLDAMTALVVDVQRLEELIIRRDALLGEQRGHDIMTELSALSLTLGEALRRVDRCFDHVDLHTSSDLRARRQAEE